MKVIDLRSDTVTRPTEAMRDAMEKAEVGDAVYGEDPTVNMLQDVAAEMVGMEAALFVPTGTMGNLVSILTHCKRGDEVILGKRSHTFLNEAGGISALGGVHPFPIDNSSDGTLPLDEISSAIRSNENPHHPSTKVITIENTHNDCGGVAIGAEYTEQLADLAHKNDLLVHLDGARIFNAAVKLGLPVKALTSPLDSVQFCLSKGLGAPVGSLICGSRDFINRAVRVRMQLGGGMRQAGIIAAAGLDALKQMVDRLQEDHERAYRLALDLNDLPGIKVPWDEHATNMVFLSFEEGSDLRGNAIGEALKREGVLVDVKRDGRIRLVVHCQISDEDVEKTIRLFRRLFGEKVK